MRRSRMAAPTDAYNASSDLAFCLFIVLIVVFVVIAKDRNQLRGDLATSHAKVEQSLLDAADRERQALERARAAESQAKRDQAALAVAMREVEEIRTELTQNQARAKAAEQEVAALRLAKAEWNAELEKLRFRDAAVRQELLGLPGSLDRVAFLIDRSASMNDDNRWDTTKSIIRTWLQYLPVKEAAIIAFGDGKATVFPDKATEGTTWIPMNEIGRQRIVQFLDGQSPAGDTPTLLALQTAAALEGIQTIMLFTDGKPSSKTRDSKIDAAREVTNFGKSKSIKGRITVNTIGLGLYYDSKDAVMMLKALAKDTDGSFRGF